MGEPAAAGQAGRCSGAVDPGRSSRLPFERDGFDAVIRYRETHGDH